MGFLLHNDILKRTVPEFFCNWEVGCYQCSDPKISPQTEGPEFFVKMNAQKILLFNEASISNKTTPFVKKFLNSSKEWMDNVVTWGLDHRFPLSSTSSSNSTHLKMWKCMQIALSFILFAEILWNQLIFQHTYLNYRVAFTK